MEKEIIYCGGGFVDSDKKLVIEMGENGKPVTRAMTAKEKHAEELFYLLDKCQSCIDYFLHGVVCSYVCGEAENTEKEIEDLLAKIKGEK